MGGRITMEQKGNTMTIIDKLSILYKNRTVLMAITQLAIVHFVEVQKCKLAPHDEEYINDIFPLYFREWK